MCKSKCGLPSPIAGDLMSRDVKKVGDYLSLAEAARQLDAWGVRGAPVVDEQGQCVGVLSVSDLARTVAQKKNPQTLRPRTCSYQEKYRESESDGQEVVHCLLAQGVCPLQRIRNLPDGKSEILCSEPNCVATDWQVVELESMRDTLVKDAMSRDVVSVRPEVPIGEMARIMLDRGVHRLLVLNLAGGPVGVVSVDDLLQVLAHPEIASTGGSR